MRDLNIVQLDIVRGESEWDAVFVNGELYRQSHTLHYEDVLEALSGRLHDVRYATVSATWLESVGCYPNRVADIPADAWVYRLSEIGDDADES